MSLPTAAVRSGRTPYDDDYGTCERSVAKLRIYGDDLDPEALTKRLGIEPSAAQRKGQVFTNSPGLSRTAKVGAWFLSSEGKVESRDLRRHLDWLIAQIRGVSSELRALQDEPAVWMNIGCVWWSKHRDGGPVIGPEHMRTLADLNLECGFEISFYGERNPFDPPEEEEAEAGGSPEARTEAAFPGIPFAP
jgi:hypothetical protein